MRTPDDLPPFLDGWDELSTLMADSGEDVGLSGYATAWTPGEHDALPDPPF